MVAAGGVHPFLTAHFLTPPFAFNPSTTKRDGGGGVGGGDDDDNDSDGRQFAPRKDGSACLLVVSYATSSLARSLD